MGPGRCRRHPRAVVASPVGTRVLDLCAAPGGKTLQLAAAGAEVTAVDISESRLGRLRENLTRTGLTATVQAGDVLDLQGSWPAILLDAPCSATGTIRRHPDLPYAKDGSEFGGLIDLQSQMIDHAWGCSMRAGGWSIAHAACCRTRGGADHRGAGTAR